MLLESQKTLPSIAYTFGPEPIPTSTSFCTIPVFTLCQNKLYKEGMNLLKKLQSVDAETCKKLKISCSKATTYTAQLQQVIDIGILPEGKELNKKGLQDFMLLVAKETADMNLLVETGKGIVRSRSN